MNHTNSDSAAAYTHELCCARPFRKAARFMAAAEPLHGASRATPVCFGLFLPDFPDRGFGCGRGL